MEVEVPAALEGAQADPVTYYRVCRGLLLQAMRMSLIHSNILLMRLAHMNIPNTTLKAFRGKHTPARVGTRGMAMLVLLACRMTSV